MIKMNKNISLFQLFSVQNSFFSPNCSQIFPPVSLIQPPKLRPGFSVGPAFNFLEYLILFANNY